MSYFKCRIDFQLNEDDWTVKIDLIIICDFANDFAEVCFDKI